MAFVTYEVYNIVRRLADFPAPSGGIITLPNNTAWIIIGAIDLGVNRIVCQNAAIHGMNVRITSLTTNNAGALITTTGNLRTQSITLSNIGAGTIYDANGASVVGTSFFTTEYVFVDGSRIGTIQNYTSAFLYRTFFLNLLGGLTVDGTVNAFTIMDGSLSSSTGGVTLVTFPATLVVSSRIRIIFTQIVANAGVTGINTNVAATISSESYILNFNNVSGGGTLFTGVQPTDSKAFFKNNRGIQNSSTIGQYYFSLNVTATVSPGTGVFAKVAGTTIAGDTERFTHTTNRLTYNGTLPQKFLVSCYGTLSTNNGNEVAIRIAKNNTTQIASEGEVTAQGAGIYVPFTSGMIVSLAQNDYIEIFVANISANNNVTVRFLNVVINAVP